METRILLRRTAVLIVLIGSCWSAKPPISHQAIGTKYFRSRTEALGVIDRLLREKDWEELAQYYDLRDSSVAPAELRTGRYFYNDGHGTGQYTEVDPPYLRPFAPGARFDHEMGDADPDVIVVVMVLEPPPGSESGRRHVYRFRLRRRGWGWQILPAQPGTESR